MNSDQDFSRRDATGALVGLLGAAVLAGCAEPEGPSDTAVRTGAVSSPLTGDLLDYASLRAIVTQPSGPISTVYVLRGRTSDGDGGGGVFIWDGDSTAGGGTGDNGGTVLKPTDRAAAQAGRWLRLVETTYSVLWFGADKSGTVDSTAAFIATTQAATAGTTIYVPAGIYLLAPDSALLWWVHKWLGDALHPTATAGTVIRPLSSGSVLANVGNAACDIQNIWFEGKRVSGGSTFQVATCLQIVGAHNSRLRWVRVSDASQYGLRVESATDMVVDQCFATGCATGMLFLGCNASAIRKPVCLDCTGPGLEIVGGAATTAPTTTLAGTISVIEAHVEGCATNGNGPMVLVRGLEAGEIHLPYVHHPASGTNIDALWVTENTHNVRFSCLRFVPGSTSVLARIKGARMCSFSDFTTSGENFGTGTNRVIITSTACAELDFFDCYRESRIANDQTALIWDNGAGTTWTAYSRNGRLQAAGAPPASLGTWQAGAVVENRAPASGAPLGWVYKTGTGWLPLPNLP